MPHWLWFVAAQAADGDAVCRDKPLHEGTVHQSHQILSNIWKVHSNLNILHVFGRLGHGQVESGCVSDSLISTFFPHCTNIKVNCIIWFDIVLLAYDLLHHTLWRIIKVIVRDDNNHRGLLWHVSVGNENCWENDISIFLARFLFC